MLRVGIDIHGVLDTYTRKFVELAVATRAVGGEVHIITGIKFDEAVEAELKSYGIPYTHYFSIVEQLEEDGVPFEWIDGKPYTNDSEAWDNAKAIYCDKMGIDFMYDDSDTYLPTFNDIDTVYLHVINPDRVIYKTRKG